MVQALPAFKALADETRLRLLAVLGHYEMNVGELVDIFEMGQSRVSRHLKILSDCGLVTYRRDGLWVFYGAARQGQGRAVLDAVAPLLDNDPVFARDKARAQDMIRERDAATKRFFDAIAGDWEGLKREILGEFNIATQIVQRMPACEVAVDLGCGTGDLLEALLGKASTVIGVDGSAKMLDVARRRFANKSNAVSLRIGELEHLPVRNAEAGFAVMSMALHHLSEPAAALREAGRVLASGGRLVVVDFEKHNNETLRFEYGDRWLGFTADELSDWLAAAGLTPVKTSRFPVNAELYVQLIEAHKP